MAICFYRKETRSIVANKVSWWLSHPMNCKLHLSRFWIFEFLLIGAKTCNGSFHVRFANWEIHFWWQ